MKPVVEQVKSEFGSKLPFYFYSLDGQDNVALADKYGVKAIPTLIFIGKDGTVSNVVIGVADKSVIEENINKIAN